MSNHSGYDRLDFGTRVGTRATLQRRHVVCGARGRLLIDATVAFEHFGAKGCQDGPAPAGSSRRSLHNRLVEGSVHAVQQNPGPLVRHAHVAGCGRDRACVADAFEQLRLTGPDPCAGLKDDADPYPSHPLSPSSRRDQSVLCVSRSAVAEGQARFPVNSLCALVPAFEATNFPARSSRRSL